MRWDCIHFFWGDERCVPPNNRDSNFGNANKMLFSRIDIPDSNIYRIQGENDPEEEALRYSEILKKHIETKGGIPVFDWAILGLGEDGHTASIFPNQLDLITSEKICEIGIHPESGQKRITLTGTVLNMAKRITFMATGTKKQVVIHHIINRDRVAKQYPAAHIQARHGEMDWFLDSSAAELI
jgi:6-phosphogluconolactonase